MSAISKVVFAVLLTTFCAFAQDFGNDSYDDNSSDSYYGDTSESSYNPDAEASDDSFNNAGAATASGDEWNGFKYEEMGLTQWEFQQAKDAGLSREKLTQLVEKGIRPSEYLQHPWKRLGVSEEDWLDQRTQGLEDSDIDRSYRNRRGDQNYAYLSLLVPSLYQWHTDQTIKAVWMDVLWGAGVGTAVYLGFNGDGSEWMYALIPILAAHIWSFADAFFNTQWDNNPDANRFSFGVMPTPDRGVASILQMRF